MFRRFRTRALLPTFLLLVLMAPAPPASASDGIEPVLDCVTYSADTVTATFGYINVNASTVDVPYGVSNFFTPAPLFRGQPTSFLPGTHHEVVRIPFPADETLTWTLSGSTVEASNDPNTYCSGSGGPLPADSSLTTPASVATTVGVDVPLTSTVTDPLAPATGTAVYGTVVYSLPDGLSAGPPPAGSPCVADSATLLSCPVTPGADNAVAVRSTTPGAYRVTGAFVATGEGDPTAADNVTSTTVVVTGPPVATTGVAGSVSATGAVLTGTVDPAGASTSYSFVYWPDGHPDQAVTTMAGGAGAGFAPVPVDATLSGQ